jgi:hypothetical protein
MEHPIHMQTLSARYEVGYRRPPAQTRFRKGLSGNPGGRPAGSRNRSLYQPLPFKPEHQPTDELILAEAYRPVTIREGDRVVELPAIQAAVRALAIAAIKGSRLAQRSLAELVLKVEARKASESLSALESALEYQREARTELALRRKLGITGLPDPIPHPDDIYVNPHSGELRYEGPRDEREKQFHDTRLARRAEAQAKVNDFAERHRQASSAEAKAEWLKQWHLEQCVFDLLNDSVQGRYKASLENRSFAEGASREGETLERVMRERKRAGGRWEIGDWAGACPATL